jgi:homoserine O-acetyltransferase
MISYRSPHNFDDRFGRETDETDGFAVQNYLRYQGDKLVNRFDANTYLTLMAAMDSHDVGRGRVSVDDALGSIKQPALVISVSSDGLYPPEEVATVAQALPGGELREIHAPHGHDAFLIRIKEVNDHLLDFIERHGLKRPLQKAVNN